MAMCSRPAVCSAVGFAASAAWQRRKSQMRSGSERLVISVLFMQRPAAPTASPRELTRQCAPRVSCDRRRLCGDQFGAASVGQGSNAGPHRRRPRGGCTPHTGPSARAYRSGHLSVQPATLWNSAGSGPASVAPGTAKPSLLWWMARSASSFSGCWFAGCSRHKRVNGGHRASQQQRLLALAARSPLPQALYRELTVNDRHDDVAIGCLDGPIHDVAIIDAGFAHRVASDPHQESRIR